MSRGSDRVRSSHSAGVAVLGTLLCICLLSTAAAQSGAGDARSGAPIDLEGHWISVLSEDWRWRVVTAPRGDYASVPLDAEGVRVAEDWDPDADPNSCLPYGAPNLMRMPTRVQIAWTGPDTLELRTEHGLQTREFLFSPTDPPAGPSRQGYSIASWDGSALKATTTSLLPGYLRRNGVPYSASTEVIEYYNTHSAYGDDGFTVTTIVRDPVYLTADFVTSSTFVRLPDGADWEPAPCSEPGGE